MRNTILLFLLATPALAAPPPGMDPNSPTHQWFEAQHSIGGAWCCDVSDGHVLDDKDWDNLGPNGAYRVRIGAQWFVIPSDVVRDPEGGPNPTGHAVAWYLPTPPGFHIYCFAPGYLY